MSDTPFSDSTSSTADVVTAVNFTGTTLTLTKQAGDDLTTTISSSPQVVTALTYNEENDDKLKLTQSAGQGSFEVTIPSGGAPAEVSFQALWTADQGINNVRFEPNTLDFNVGSPSGYGWISDATSSDYGKFICHSSTEGLYIFITNAQISDSHMSARAYKTTFANSIAGTYATNVHPDDITISFSFLVRLVANDKVFIQASAGQSGAIIRGDSTSRRSRMLGYRIAE